MFFIDTVGTRGENPVAKILNFIRDVGGFISRIKVSMEESFISAYMFLERQSHLVQYSRNLELQIARLKTENNVLTNQAEELKRLEITSGFKERNRRFNLTGAKIIRREPAQWLCPEHGSHPDAGRRAQPVSADQDLRHGGQRPGDDAG